MNPIPSAPAIKPEIIVVAVAIDPVWGSEPGKGWWWSCALSRHYRLHIVTGAHSSKSCRDQPIVEQDGWIFHTTNAGITTWKMPTGPLQYMAWLKEALAISRDLTKRFPIHGLCHISLGSFRFLPRYDRLGVPYVIGPLGGGECSPLGMTWKRPVPLSHKISETLRPLFNNSFALVPPLRACMKGADLVLNTSQETEQVVRRMGARHTAVVFPDAYDIQVDVEKMIAQRGGQLDAVKKQIRLVWQGRPLWWKGPDLALMIIRRALDAGLAVQLTMVSSWGNDFEKGVRELAEKLQVAPHVKFVGNMARDKFLELAGEHHGMIATSLHDSGGIPLLEAQALGLPCLTLGLGGHKLAACPKAGVSESPHDIEAFLKKSVDCLANWQHTPETWLEESKQSIEFSSQFTIDHLARDVSRFIAPALKRRAG